MSFTNTNPFRRQQSSDNTTPNANREGVLVDLSDDHEPLSNGHGEASSSNPFYDKIPASTQRHSRPATNPFEDIKTPKSRIPRDQDSEVSVDGTLNTEPVEFGEGERSFFENYGIQPERVWRADVLETRGTKPDTNQEVIVKLVRKRDQGQILNLKREIAVLELLKDVEEPAFPQMIQWLEFNSSICMAFEYRSSQTLREYVESAGPAPEEYHKSLAMQMFSAMTNLFILELAHLRLCDETVHLDDKFNLILTNFDYVHNYGKAKEGDIYAPIKEKYGSDIYVAPEVFANITYNARKAVLWSCGVVLYFMYSGQTEKLSNLDHPAFETDKPVSRRKSVSTKVQSTSNIAFIHYPNRSIIPAFAKDIISKLLINDPLRRAELIEVTTKVPKEFVMHGTRPLMELAWMDYKMHVGPLAGTLRRNTISDSASSLFSFSSRFSDPLTNFLGRRKSSISKNLSMGGDR